MADNVEMRDDDGQDPSQRPYSVKMMTEEELDEK